MTKKHIFEWPLQQLVFFIGFGPGAGHFKKNVKSLCEKLFKIL
jgi:hypothetical protein